MNTDPKKIRARATSMLHIAEQCRAELTELANTDTTEAFDEVAKMFKLLETAARTGVDPPARYRRIAYTLAMLGWADIMAQSLCLTADRKEADDG